MLEIEEMSKEHIPEELVMKIFVRLPVKSILRFRTLNKSYNALTRETSFITKHLYHSIEKAEKNPNFLIFHQTNKLVNSTVFEDEQSQPHSIYLNPPFISVHVNNIGACSHFNGIIYLELFGVPLRPNPKILWNPGTREVRFLPFLPQMKPTLFTLFHGVHGFGVNPITNDFKVVNIIVDAEIWDGSDRKLIGQVYNLHSDSWKVVNAGVLAYFIYKSMFNAYLNGVYHWLAISSLRDHVEFVLCFDMSDDVFWKMNLPQFPSQEENNELCVSNHNVVVLNDHIGYVREYTMPFEIQFEMWVMNDYGVEGSWVRMFNIARGTGLGKILEIWKDDNDDVVVLGGEEHHPLVLYKIGQQQVVKEFNVCFRAEHHVVRYVESFLPLSGLVDEEA
ncbi:putative F-box protein At3g16210 [Lotus japonicus]|uniref:putative F-box protein At3g16210 n=1 Tax=Lotus japonicus TaxID=34305 RepID=UPI002588F8C6|nr:putative F-box protein At3g16210 [Lotus japonicus]